MTGVIQRGGWIEHRCAVNPNHRALTVVTIRRGAFVLEVCGDCAKDEAKIKLGIAKAAADLVESIASRR